MQEGAVDAGSYKVTQRGAGANMSVDIAASTGIGALVQGDSVMAQGLYSVPPHTAVINEAITTAHATLPRLDQVVLELLDDTHAGGGLNKARIRVIAGTATSGATLDNRSGAAALPSSAVRLADVIVAAADTSIIDTEIRDRRPWARGAFKLIQRNSGDYTRAVNSYAAVDATNLSPRIECSGVPLKVTLEGGFTNSTTNSPVWELFVDSVAQNMERRNSVNAAFDEIAGIQWVIALAPGSHKLEPQWKTDGGTATFRAVTPNTVTMTVEEIVRQDASN